MKYPRKLWEQNLYIVTLTKVGISNKDFHLIFRKEMFVEGNLALQHLLALHFQSSMRRNIPVHLTFREANSIILLKFKWFLTCYTESASLLVFTFTSFSTPYRWGPISLILSKFLISAAHWEIQAREVGGHCSLCVWSTIDISCKHYLCYKDFNFHF